jgi:hypothetical protein
MAMREREPFSPAVKVVFSSRAGRRYLELGEASQAWSLMLDTKQRSVINAGLSEINGAFSVPPPSDNRQRNGKRGSQVVSARRET